MRRIQPATPTPPLYSIACHGDSQSEYSPILGNFPELLWPPVLADALRRSGGLVRARNFGVSGLTSKNILDRVDALFMYDTPTVAVVYIGVNDPGNGISQTQTQENLQAIIKAVKHRALGPGDATPGIGSVLGGPVYVATETSLPAAGRFGQRYVVLADASGTGGVAAWHTTQAATVVGAGGGNQSVWEWRNPLGGVLGWGRIAFAATTPTVCDRIVIVSTNYLNFTSGGDTLAAPYAANLAVRTAQQAAVTAENVAVDGIASVVYADLYNFQRSRIVAGTDPDFSQVAYDQTKSWHVATGNQHHNMYGHWQVAQAIIAALPPAWTDALTS